MSDFYDRQGNPMTLNEWGRKHQDKDYKILGSTMVGDELVSTVWLGMDHGWGEGAPVIFETMIFHGPHDQWQDRYTTEEAALAGHKRVVNALTNGTPLPGEEAPDA